MKTIWSTKWVGNVRFILNVCLKVSAPFYLTLDVNIYVFDSLFLFIWSSHKDIGTKMQNIPKLWVVCFFLLSSLSYAFAFNFLQHVSYIFVDSWRIDITTIRALFTERIHLFFFGGKTVICLETAWGEKSNEKKNNSRETTSYDSFGCNDRIQPKWRLTLLFIPSIWTLGYRLYTCFLYGRKRRIPCNFIELSYLSTQTYLILFDAYAVEHTHTHSCGSCV